MNKKFFCPALLSLCMFGCSVVKENTYFFPSDIKSQKINSLADIDGDKKSDPIFWNTSTMSRKDKFLEPCFFEVVNSNNHKHSEIKFGEVGDIPLFGYFDDDNIADFGVYRCSQTSCRWFIRHSSGGIEEKEFGKPGELPVPADYDGDGKSDIAVYRLVDGLFKSVLSISGASYQFKLGVNENLPVPKDFDGDGRADFAFYGLKDGKWTIKNSGNNTISEVKLGGPSFLPFPSDYDGDGKCDLCVWNYKTNEIEMALSSLRRKLSVNEIEAIGKGLGGKKLFPIPLDYDGDGISELAFWDSSSKLLFAFTFNDTSFKKKVYKFSEIKNSFPVTNFLAWRELYKIRNDVKVAEKGENSNFISDFDGDYVSDSCKWSMDSAVFLCESSRLNLMFALPLGVSADIPVVGNFNADNITDLAIYRAGVKTFYIRYLGKFAPKDVQIVRFQSEISKDSFPKIDDYDGDGIDDFAIDDPISNKSFIKLSSQGFK